MKNSMPSCSGFTETDENTKTCRICFEKDGKKMISPCNCEGYLKYVHSDCLQKWVSIRMDEKLPENQKKLWKGGQISCQICKFYMKFKIEEIKSLVNCDGFKRNVEKKGGVKICFTIILVIILVALIGIFGTELSQKDKDSTKEVRALVCLLISSIILLIIMCYFIKKIGVHTNIKIKVMEKEEKVQRKAPYLSETENRLEIIHFFD